MKILIPIYPNCLRDKSLLKYQINGVSLALHLVRELCLGQNEDIHVFTAEDSTDDYSSYPVHHHRQPLKCKQSYPFAYLPVGACESIEYIKQHSEDPTETVLIVDYRTTNLSIALINKAYQSYMVSPRLPLLSVHIVKDNPAQFQRYFSIVASDILSILEEENYFTIDSSALQSFFTTQGGIYRTKPAPFNWAPYGYPAGMRLKEFFVRLVTEDGYRFIPIERFVASEQPPNCRPELYFKESHEKARRILQIKTSFSENNSKIHAVSAVRQSGKSMFLLTKNKDEQFYALFLHENCWGKSDMEIRLQPFFLDSQTAERYCDTIVYTVPEERAGPSIDWQNSKYYGPACIVQFDTQQPDGFTVSALSRHINEYADFSEPVSLADFCSVSSDGSRKINKSTGQEINGRQSCPDFFQVNSAFIFSRLKDLPDIEQKMIAGKTRGFKFDCNQIRSEFDLLCVHNTQQEGYTYVS